jgi:hypothetical protein
MTTTIERTIDIPVDRRLSLELPETVSCGRATVVITIIPQPVIEERAAQMRASIPSLDDFKRKAAAKAARRAAEGRKPFEAAIKMAAEGRNFFEGIDPVEYQRSLRNEWDY